MACLFCLLPIAVILFNRGDYLLLRTRVIAAYVAYVW